MYASMPDTVTFVMCSAQRDTEAVIIPGKISIIPPQFPQTGRGKTSKAPLFWGILRRNWRNRTRYSNEIVI
ncbi:hypothetical protein E2C01_042233 [Portunus trituberculatus]|uniref:Uncharacterized protein n=1 Tax=Portunus trituberculatus TaxID=210409 RepID=A0A5B7FL89_PORTR|nr:hypothetical protein [Portunus trituberculatus]